MILTISQFDRSIPAVEVLTFSKERRKEKMSRVFRAVDRSGDIKGVWPGGVKRLAHMLEAQRQEYRREQREVEDQSFEMSHDYLWFER